MPTGSDRPQGGAWLPPSLPGPSCHVVVCGEEPLTTFLPGALAAVSTGPSCLGLSLSICKMWASHSDPVSPWLRTRVPRALASQHKLETQFRVHGLEAQGTQGRATPQDQSCPCGVHLHPTNVYGAAREQACPPGLQGVGQGTDLKPGLLSRV